MEIPSTVKQSEK